jgi:hypothetical protein
MNTQKGVALVLVVLFTSFLSAIGLGLALVVFMDRLATGNVRGSVAMLYAADAGIELAAHDLARAAEWDLVLSGGQPASFTDGAAGGMRDIPGGGSVDLTAATNQLNCGRVTACTVAQMNANSRERPWGANNPRWQLFAYGPFGGLTAIERPTPCYLAVWVADDSREVDADPLSDGAGESTPGYGILRVRAEAYGPRGSRRAIEAELARFCLPGAEPGSCRPGIRVQSWQELRQALP